MREVGLVVVVALAGCSQLLGIDDFTRDAPAPDEATADAAPDAPPDASDTVRACTTLYTDSLADHLYARTPGRMTLPHASAQSRCAADGAHLVKIDTAGENTLVDLVRGNERAWIGLDDRAADGDYRWYDGSELGDFTAWSSNEPNDIGGAEDCIEATNAGWNDTQCGYAFDYVCECEP